MSRPFALPGVAALVASLCLAMAFAPARSAPLVQLTVLDRDDGRGLPEYPWRGERWIAGTPGHRYAVELTNRSPGRVLVVLSVDGVNAVSGQTAHPAQTGYVLEPWQNTRIDGWRKSYDDIAQFVFTDLPDSYAARTGRPDDVGVIGIAVFREAAPPPPPPPPSYPAPVAHERDASATRAGNANKAASAASREAAASDTQAQRMGTGHGEREWAPVSRTEFVRASARPAQLTQLRYDDASTLVARGIVPPRGRWDWPRGPRAFPGGFVADPPPRW